MKRFLHDHGLTLVMLGLFAMFWLGQSLTGFSTHNKHQRWHGEEPDTFSQYLRSGDFLEATFENWESEFLQMGCFVLLAVGLRQRGSSQSKPMHGKSEHDEDPRKHRSDPDAPWPVRRGGWVLTLYSSSLSLALFSLFLFSFVMHGVGGWMQFNEEAPSHGEAAISLGQFLLSATFWQESFQNWQSEFLSVGVLVFLSVYLRQKGSPESKPVHASHRETGI